MKKLLLFFALACLLLNPATVFAGGAFTDYPSSTTALAYDGKYFWLGQEYKVLKWDKNAGILAEYTSKDGLPGSSIKEIYIAPDKKTIWAASDSSIARFDGTTWHTFTRNEGAPYASIGKVAFEQNGTIWIFTGDAKGVYRYNGNAWKQFTSTDGLASDTVYAIAVDNAGVVWVGTSNGVSAYDGSVWKTYTTADGLSDNVVGHIVVDKNNVKWFGLGGEIGGITRFDGTTWTSYTMLNGLVNAVNVLEMAVGPDNSLWVSMCDNRYIDGKIIGAQKISNGYYFYYSYLYKFDGKSFIVKKAQLKTNSYSYTVFYRSFVFDNNGTFYVCNQIPSNKSVHGLFRKDQLCDSDNIIWFIEVSTGSWLASYDGKRHQQGFGPPINISALTVGPKNEVWAGDSQGGIAEYTDNTWKVAPYEDSVLGSVCCLAANEEKTIWVGESYYRLTKYQWDKYNVYYDYLQSNIQSLAFDSHNTLWMGFGSNGKGIAAYDGTTWPQYTTADGLIDDNVNTIAVDSSNAKWFGTSTGISRFDGVTWQSFPSAENGKLIGKVNVLAFDTKDVLWAGINNGLLRYDGSTWSRFTPKEGLADTLVLSLAVNSKGVTWAGTPNGLSRYDGKTWTTFTTENGLPGNRVQALAVDHNDLVWIGTDQGLVSYKEDGSGTFVNHEMAKPTAFPTLSAYPNPFNPSTMIECVLPGGGVTELAVYSITGQKMKTITAGFLSAGKHSFLWNGKDDSGHAVSSGIYIARLTSGAQSITKKMVLVK